MEHAADPAETWVSLEGVMLPVLVQVVEPPRGVVVFAHGSGSSRLSPRNRLVAAELGKSGFSTVLFDLLTEEEAADRRLVFDVPLLSSRLVAVHRWIDPDLGAVGYFGASTGAAASLVAAVDQPVAAVVSRGGRPDLAGPMLERVRAPTLLVVGGADHEVLELNRRALAHLPATSRLEVIPGAGHLFEEPGTLEAVAAAAAGWFEAHLGDGEGD
jgi:dienelactone hydrolase